MKFFCSWCTIFFLFSVNALAKPAIVHITIKNFKGSFSIYDPKSEYNLTKKWSFKPDLDMYGSTSYTTNIDQPSYLILYFSSDKFFNYSLFLSPGDELFLTADFSKKYSQVTVTGEGSNNNQPEIFALTNMDTEPFKGDKDPDQVLAAIEKQYLLNKSILADYIKVNKPSAAFITSATNNLKYFVPDNYYEFSHNNNFSKPQDQLTKWKKIQDSILSTVQLSNNDALTSYNYTQLIGSVVLREAEDAWLEYKSNPTEFYQHWFPANPSEGKKVYTGGLTGILNNMVIDKYFSGKAAENAYGQTIKLKLVRADYPAVVSMFDHFKKEFPASEYVKGFIPTIAEVVSKQQQTFNKETIFVTDNGTRLKTFKNVLALTKGKVALVDMWGTWCSPCRTEIEKNALKLEAHFKGKNINFIYVANLDIGREQEWKKAIAYFQIGGIHILANPALTKDIMDKAKFSGYPSYILINKDGSYRRTAIQPPVNLQTMIEEIEAANL